MANIVGLDLNIDQDYLADAVKQTVMMGIAESLNGKNEIVSQIVNMVLKQKVNKANIELPKRKLIRKRQNRPLQERNVYSLLEFYVRKLIKDVLCDEMQTMVEEHREEITKTIRAELQKKVNYNKFVDAFIGNVSSAINSTWCPRIEIQFEKTKEY